MPHPVGGDRAVINERVGKAVAVHHDQLPSVGVLRRAGAKLERTLGAVAPGLNLTQVASDILGLLVKRRDLDEIVDTHDRLLIPV
jgi:hypothetical protein